MVLTYRDPEKKEGTGTLTFGQALFMFIKVHLVSGFLFLPKGFLDGGWLFSLTSLVFVICLTMYCYMSISQCSDKLRTYSLAKIGYQAFGKCGKYSIEIIIAITQVI